METIICVICGIRPNLKCTFLYIPKSKYIILKCIQKSGLSILVIFVRYFGQYIMQQNLIHSENVISPVFNNKNYSPGQGFSNF